MTTQKEQKYEQATEKLVKELEARKIPRETVDNALEIMGELLPTVQEIDKDIRLAYFGILCYHAGRTERGYKIGE